MKGKYLGFQIGPRAGDTSWTAPIDKYKKRIMEWEGAHTGLFWNSIYYYTFVVTALEFLAQLENFSDEVINAEASAMRRLAPGPGTWILQNDLEHLKQYGIGNGFRLIGLTAYAAKLRLMSELGCKRLNMMDEQLRIARSNFLARPFGAWHYKSFVQTLFENERQLRAEGVSINGILILSKDNATFHFQKETRLQIRKIRCNYDLENRV